MSTRSIPYLEISVMVGLMLAGLLFGYLVIGNARSDDAEPNQSEQGDEAPPSAEAPKSNEASQGDEAPSP